jgi:hypothetical protein
MAARNHAPGRASRRLFPRQAPADGGDSAELLASTPAAAVTFDQVLYHPEAIMLGVTPAETLTAIYDAARSATHQVTGALASDGQLDDPEAPIESECAAPLRGVGIAEASRVRWPISVSYLAGRPYCIRGIGFFPTAATP